MADVSGQRDSGNVASSQRVVDMDRPIHLLEPSSTPLISFTNNLRGRKMKCSDSLFKWHEDELEVRFDAINNGGGYTSSQTSIVVDNGDYFAAEDIVKVPRTGELLYVQSISTNTLTVSRGFGSSTAAALNDDDPLYILGSAAEEGDTSLAARSDNPTPVTNYTQIFKHSVEASGTWLSSSNESTPHDWPHQIRKAKIEHDKDKELAFLFGSKGTDTGPIGGKPLRTTGGVIEYATENNLDASGALTEAEMETFVRGFFRYGSQRRILFASPLLVSVLSGFARSALQTSVGATQYGVRVMEWISPHGTLGIVKHNLLDGSEYGGYGVAVDFNEESVRYRYLNGGDAPEGSRDTKLLRGRQPNDADYKKDEILSEVGLQFGNPKKHGVLTGVTS